MKRIESKILFWILILTGIPLGIITWQSIHCSLQAITEIQTSHLHSVLNWKALEIRSTYKEMENDLQMLSIVSFEKNSEEENTPDCHQYGCTCSPLTHFKENKDLYTDLGAYSLDGTLISNANEDPSNNPPSLSQSFISKINKNPGITILKNYSDGNPQWTAGIRVINSSTGIHTGYIAAKVNLNALLKNTLTPFMSASFNVSVLALSENGHEFFIDKLNDTIQVSEKISPLSETLDKKNISSLSEYTYNNRTSFILTEWLEQPGVFLTVMIDKKDSMKWIHILLKRGITTGLTLLLLGLLAALLISKKLSSPLKELEHVSKQIVDGNHNARVQKMDTLEAENVRIGFNTMLDRLQEQHKKLIQASSLAAIGELSSSIVHEMRNPLSSVKLNVNAIRKKLEKDPVYSELADIAVIQVDRLEKMLTELLKFGSPIDIKSEKIHILQLIKNCLPLVQDLVEIKKLNVQLNINTPKELTVSGTEEYLTRAFSNILKNAAEACHSMGQINIDVKTDKKMVHIKVTDEGDGIAEAVENLLFKPFFTTKENGTGLGLANVKKIVEIHNGTVRLENVEGSGACFTLSLPV